MRQIILDTETTGLEPQQGHRIIEVGCVELIDRRHTGNRYHQYINPERDVEEAAIEVHGLSRETLAEQPVFADVADELLHFIRDSELIIHNAAFDVGFLDAEFSLLGADWGETADYCRVLDSLRLARERHPGQRNSLDALCKRYAIDNSGRDLHGALLDAELLADVYLAMTGGQTSLGLTAKSGRIRKGAGQVRRTQRLPVIPASRDEHAAHDEILAFIEQESGHCLWAQGQGGEAAN